MVHQAEADRLAEKLQAFYDGLPAGEQGILADLLQQAAGDGDVEGFIPQEPFRVNLYLSGATLNPGLGTKLSIPVRRTTHR